jgi:hypothetical protein
VLTAQPAPDPADQTVTAPADRSPTAPTGERVSLPSWMRDPDSQPKTIRRRVSLWLDRQPLLAKVHRFWWKLLSRRTLTDRYPRVMPVVSFLLVALTASALVAAALYTLYQLLAEARGY